MKGYRAASGNYITGAEIRQRKAKFKKEAQEERRREEMECDKVSNLLASEFLNNLKQQKEMAEYETETAHLKRDFIDGIGKYQLPYNQFLIVWDIINSNVTQVEADYIKGRIDKTDIKTAISLIPKRFISDYNIDYLLGIAK